jgi:hypothetical protein
MRALQPLLQRGLQSLDPWLDAVFPIATALICAKQRLAGYSLLAIYLFLRLLQRSDQEPWRWILISLLVVNAGMIVEDRDLKPGGPSDYLIVALSFAAALQRSNKQWRRSITWMASSIIPLITFSLAAGNQLIQADTISFTGFNINRLGFLAGFLIISSYSLSKLVDSRFGLIFSFLLTAASIAEAILTQSRSSLAVPALTIAVNEIATIRWSPKRLCLAFIFFLIIGSSLVQLWYGEGNPGGHGNRIADGNRIETIRCWIRNTSASQENLAFGVGYGKAMQKMCTPEKIKSIAERDKPLAHAHNLYVQILAEAGLPGLILFIFLTIQALRHAWRAKASPLRPFTKPLTLYLTLMALGATWHSMMINQVLVGYSLAALTAVDPDPCVADATIPETQPTASAPQG